MIFLIQIQAKGQKGKKAKEPKSEASPARGSFALYGAPPFPLKNIKNERTSPSIQHNLYIIMNNLYIIMNNSYIIMI